MSRSLLRLTKTPRSRTLSRLSSRIASEISTYGVTRHSIPAGDLSAPPSPARQGPGSSRRPRGSSRERQPVVHPHPPRVTTIFGISTRNEFRQRFETSPANHPVDSWPAVFHGDARTHRFLNFSNLDTKPWPLSGLPWAPAHPCSLLAKRSRENGASSADAGKNVTSEC